jgi:hypothetical protein
MRTPAINPRAAESIGGPPPASQAPPLGECPGAPPAAGPWKAGQVSDAGTPLGKGFTVGATVYVRQEGEGVWQILRLAGGGAARAVRRRVTQTQVMDFVRGLGDALPAGKQAQLAQAWERLEPKHAGFLPGTRIPRFYQGLPIQLRATAPAVLEKDWQADWDERAIYFERRVWVNPPRKVDPEQDEEDIRVTLEHESYERAQANRIADDLAPYADPATRARLAEENEGLAHARTIGMVDGYFGPDAEQDYYRGADKQFALRRGFKEAASWPDGAET